MRIKQFGLLIFIFLVGGTSAQVNDTNLQNGEKYIRSAQVNDTNLQNGEKYIRIACCDVLELLSKYLLRSTGDLIQIDNCKEQERKCLSLKLIETFVNHSRVLMNSTAGIHRDDTHIVISKQTMLQNTAKIVVLAFLGGSVPTENGLIDAHLTLEYDNTLEKISVRDSTCAINKTIYSTIVLASIVLVVFFIAIQVIQMQKKKESHEDGDAGSVSSQQAIMFRHRDSGSVLRVRH